MTIHYRLKDRLILMQKTSTSPTYLAILAIGATVVSASAHAKSCTDQGKLCASWAQNPANEASIRAAGATSAQAASRCTGLLTSQCKANCKAGDKNFVGLAGGNYPIDTCN
jgi:hypothetical protein